METQLPTARPVPTPAPVGTPAPMAATPTFSAAYHRAYADALEEIEHQKEMSAYAVKRLERRTIFNAWVFDRKP